MRAAGTGLIGSRNCSVLAWWQGFLSAADRPVLPISSSWSVDRDDVHSGGSHSRRLAHLRFDAAAGVVSCLSLLDGSAIVSGGS